MSSDQTTKTARDLITGALRKIGQYAPGESLDPNDAEDALDTLNGMLDLWSNQRLAVYNQIETVQNLTAGQASYTIGSGGYFNIERPYRIAKCYSRLTTTNSTVDFPCDVMTLEKYGDIGLKSQPGPWPKEVYYNSGWPQGTLVFWPVPSSNVEFHLWTDQVFTALNLTTVVSLPRGYFLGLQYALAELLCSEYGMAVPPDIKQYAKDFRSVLKDQNATPQAEVPLEPTLLAGGNSNDAGWILHGGFR
jgi:hypothetical protein